MNEHLCTQSRTLTLHEENKQTNKQTTEQIMFEKFNSNNEQSLIRESKGPLPHPFFQSVDRTS